MAIANIYKVYVDTTDDDVAVWTMEATCPAMAIKKVLNRVSYGKSAKMENFEISAELVARDTTYAQYKAAQHDVCNVTVGVGSGLAFSHTRVTKAVRWLSC